MLSDSPHATPRLKRLAVRPAAGMCAIAVGFGLAGCGSNTNSSAANTTTESAAENTSTAAAEPASDSTAADGKV